MMNQEIAKCRVAFLNECDFLREWKVGDRILCGHCERIFLAEEVGTEQSMPEYEGDEEIDLAVCPHCQAGILDFEFVVPVKGK